MNINISQLKTIDDCLDFLASEINPIVNTDGRQYPFIGEKGVRHSLELSQDLRIANAVLMFHLQTEAEQAKKETTDKNRRGLMSSHAATASSVIPALLDGIEPDAELVYRADGQKFVGHEAYLSHLGGRYAKQLSVALRCWAIARHPELGVTAQMFSVR